MEKSIGFKKIYLILEYSLGLIKKYKEQHNQQADIYRIAEIKHSPTGQCKIIIQVVGKSTFLECTPQEIVSDDLFIQGFSKIDIRTITYFACEQIKKPKYKILVQEFCEKINKMLFKLKIQDDDKVIVRTASQISMDKSLINDLSQEDAQSISYIAGYEHSSIEKIEIELAKNAAQ